MRSKNLRPKSPKRWPWVGVAVSTVKACSSARCWKVLRRRLHAAKPWQRRRDELALCECHPQHTCYGCAQPAAPKFTGRRRASRLLADAAGRRSHQYLAASLWVLGQRTLVDPRRVLSARHSWCVRCSGGVSLSPRTRVRKEGAQAFKSACSTARVG